MIEMWKICLYVHVHVCISLKCVNMKSTFFGFSKKEWGSKIHERKEAVPQNIYVYMF